MKAKAKCKFGEVLLKFMNEKGYSTYSLAERLGLSSNRATWGYVSCTRFPSIVKMENRISIIELAEALNLTKAQKYLLYSALIDTFYDGLSKFFKNIEEEKLTDKYIKSLLERKKTETWEEIHAYVPEPSIRKIRQLRSDISLLNRKDPLSKLLTFLKLSDKEKAEILYYFLKKKGAEEEFLKILKGE